MPPLVTIRTSICFLHLLPFFPRSTVLPITDTPRSCSRKKYRASCLLFFSNSEQIYRNPILQTRLTYTPSPKSKPCVRIVYLPCYDTSHDQKNKSKHTRCTRGLSCIQQFSSLRSTVYNSTTITHHLPPSPTSQNPCPTPQPMDKQPENQVHSSTVNCGGETTTRCWRIVDTDFVPGIAQTGHPLGEKRAKNFTL